MTAANFAASSPDRTTARVRLRPTMSSDIDYVVSLEQAQENLAFITPWESTQHEAAIRFPDFRHFIVEGGFESMIVMSMLQSEFTGRRGLGLEMRAP